MAAVISPICWRTGWPRTRWISIKKCGQLKSQAVKWTNNLFNKTIFCIIESLVTSIDLCLKTPGACRHGSRSWCERIRVIPKSGPRETTHNKKIERIARKINEKRQFSMNKRRENENAKTLQVLSSVWGKFQFFRLAGMYCFFNPSFRGCRWPTTAEGEFAWARCARAR